MQIKDKVVVVTGGGNGIGRALCLRFAEEGARRIVVADRNQQAADQVAAEIGGLAVTCDVAAQSEVIALVDQTVETCGPIDLFCSNAGVTVSGGVEISNDDWQKMWQVNTMSHVYAARAVIPGMLERGGGYLLQTASAAGLLTEIGSAPYSATKHAAVGFAEWLSIRYGKSGIGVSCLCPMGVQTDMLAGDDQVLEFLQISAVSPEIVAECAVRGIAAERFLILPHPEVADFFQYKADDYERFLKAFRRLQEKIAWKTDRNRSTRTERSMTAD